MKPSRWFGGAEPHDAVAWLAYGGMIPVGVVVITKITAEPAKSSSREQKGSTHD